MNHTIVNFDVVKKLHSTWNFFDKPLIKKTTHEIIKEEVAKIKNYSKDFLKPYGGNDMITSIIEGIVIVGSLVGIVP